MRKTKALQQSAKNILPVIPDINDEIFERAGITKEDRARMVSKVFKSTEQRLGAMEVKVFHDKGDVVYSKPLVDHGTRGKAIEQAMQLVGLQKQEAPKVTIKANVILPSWAVPQQDPKDVTPSAIEITKQDKE